MIDVNLVDGRGTNSKVGVSSNGELLTRPFDYSSGKFHDMDVVDTAYHFWPPLPEMLFVITGYVISTDKDVGVNGATVIIYEAATATTIAVDKIILQTNMLKNTLMSRENLQVIVTLGEYLNAKTDDDDVFMTIEGYYVKEGPNG